MYINYQQNTNLKERKKLFDLFKDEEWVDVDDPNLKLEEYVEKLNSSSNEPDKLLNQSVKYQFKFANSSFSLNLSREKYRSLKSFSEKIIHKFFGPKPSHSFTNVLVAEFDPIKFKNLFVSSNNSDVSLCMYNRRRPSIWNKQSYSIVKNSNAQILSPLMLNENIQKKCIKKTWTLIWNICHLR